MLSWDPPPPSPPTNRWLVTLVDLVSILLTFFVLAFAGSAVPLPAWQTTSAALHATFGGGDPAFPVSVFGNPTAPATEGSAYLAAVLAAVLAEGQWPSATPEPVSDLPRDLWVAEVGGSIVIALARKRVFYPHSGEMIPEAPQVLGAVVAHLARLQRPILVAVEAGSADGDRRLALQRAGVLGNRVRALAPASAAASYAIAAPAQGLRGEGAPCPGAVLFGAEAGLVLCIKGDGQ